jgi:hypothetical protein
MNFPGSDAGGERDPKKKLTRVPYPVVQIYRPSDLDGKETSRSTDADESRIG